jgi:hypothetical protein
MRAQAAALARRSAAAGRDAFVLVNNKAEGSSPLTVTAIARLLAEGLRETAGTKSGGA